jgi:hypothetical protein
MSCLKPERIVRRGEPVTPALSNLSRDAQFELAFAEQIGIEVETSPQQLRRIPAMKKPERDGRNEVEMHRPKVSQKIVGILDIDLCRGGD